MRGMLEVFALDNSFSRASGPIPYKTLTWTRRYYECGEFCIEVAMSVYDPKWQYIYCDDRPETGIIEKVVVTDDAPTPAGEDTVMIRGRFLECLMHNRCFLVEQTEEETYLEDRTLTRARSVPHYNPKEKLVTYGDTGYMGVKDSFGVITTQDGSEGWDNDSTWQEIYAHDLDYGYLSRNEDNSFTLITAAYEQQIPKSDVVWDAGADTATEWNQTPSSVWFRMPGGTLYRQASPVASFREGVVTHYTTEYYNLKYQTVETRMVRGPWQRLAANDPELKKDNLAHLLDWVQFLYHDEFIYLEPPFAGTSKVIDPSLQYMDEILYQECREEQCSFRIEYDFRTDRIVWSYWRGEDRTQSQSDNPFYTFSDAWGTMHGWAYSEDGSDYRNTCYVLWGTNDQQKTKMKYVSSYDSEDNPIYSETEITSEIQNRHMTTVRLDDGLPDYECWLDLRGDEQCENEAQAKAAGELMLSTEHPLLRMLDTGVVETQQYMEDYDLGDKVDLVIETLGVMDEVRIIEVQESYTAGKAEITLTVGDQRVRKA